MIFRTSSGVKDASADPAGAARLIGQGWSRVSTRYSGDDSLTLPLLAVGASVS